MSAPLQKGIADTTFLVILLVVLLIAFLAV